MSLLDSIVLGIIEGFTEFLPVSSTAHLVLTSRLLGIETSDFLKSFEIATQLGAIFAVVFLYWKTLASKWEINKRIVTAFVPTAIVGLVFYNLLKNFLLANHMVSIYTLLVGGIVLIIFEFIHKERPENIEHLENISYSKAFIIGLFQSISIIPGVSRAAATIIGGLSLGIKRKTIVEFSFLLAIPTMAAATGLDLLKSVNQFSRSDFLDLSAGFIVSFIMATISVSFLLKLIRNHNFISFGIYRIIIALSFLYLL